MRALTTTIITLALVLGTLASGFSLTPKVEFKGVDFQVDYYLVNDIRTEGELKFETSNAVDTYLAKQDTGNTIWIVTAHHEKREDEQWGRMGFYKGGWNLGKEHDRLTQAWLDHNRDRIKGATPEALSYMVMASYLDFTDAVLDRSFNGSYADFHNLND